MVMVNQGSPPRPPPHHHHHHHHLQTIFVDTSIDTHLALIVSHNDTISDVKGKIRAEHALCFQDIGEITIQAIKVRRRGFFYNLVDSMNVSNAFDGVKGSWFLCVDAVPICPVKAQNVLSNNVTHELLEYCDYKVPTCGVDKQKGIVFCELLPNNQDTVLSKPLAGDLDSVKHKNQKPIDASLKELPVEDDPSLQNGRTSPAQSVQACSTDLLIPSDRITKSLNGAMVNIPHLVKGVTVSHFENEKNSGPDGQGRHSPIVPGIDHCHRPEKFIDQEDGGRNNFHNYFGIESNDVMPSSTCNLKRKSSKRSKNLKDGLHEDHLDNHGRGSKISRTEDKKKSNKSVNLPQKINCDGKTEIVAASSERLLSKLPHESNISVHNPPVEKNKKKRKRNLPKLNEEEHLAMPFEIVAPVTVDPHISGKEVNASISLGKSPTELNNEKQMSDVDRDINLAPNIVSLLEVTNQKEIRHCMDTCLNKETAEVQTLQVDPVGRRKRHLNLGQETNLDVSFKEPEKAKVSSQVTPEFSNKVTNDHHQNMVLDDTRCIMELNSREETGSVDANSGISASSEKFPYQEQPSDFLSKGSSSDKHQTLDKEANAAANPKGENRDKFLEHEFKLPRASRRSRKSSKSELRVFNSTELNVSVGHTISDAAQVISHGVQNDATELIKQAEQKVSEGHNSHAMIEISSSSQKLLNQDQVSCMNTCNPPISVPHNLNKKSRASHKAAAEINSPSQPASKIQEKHLRSRKKSKSELTKPSGIDDAVLPKLNCELVEKASNQKMEQHCIDVKVTDPLIHEDISALAKVHQVNPLDSSSCKPQDLGGQSDAKIILGSDVPQHEELACPTKFKPDSKKSQKEVRASSEMSEGLDLRRPDNSNINFAEHFVSRAGKSCSDLPSKNSDTRKKHKTCRKTDTNQPCQESPTNLLQSTSHKHHKVASQTKDNDTSHCSTVDASQYATVKDSKRVNAQIPKKTKRSSKQKMPSASIESDLYVHKAHENQKKLEELHDYGPQSCVELSKTGDTQCEQVKKITALGNGFAFGHGIDHYSPSGDMSNEESLSDGTRDTPDDNRRYRIVRKISTRGSKKIIDSSNPESLLDSSGRVFNASSGSSNSGSESQEGKASIGAGLFVSGNSGSHLEELQTKATGLKLQTVTSSSESETSGELGKSDGCKAQDHSRPAASAQKIHLSAILKSSSSYKKARLTASQSEFADSQPVDVVLETQSEPSP